MVIAYVRIPLNVDVIIICRTFLQKPLLSHIILIAMPLEIPAGYAVPINNRGKSYKVLLFITIGPPFGNPMRRKPHRYFLNITIYMFEIELVYKPEWATAN